MWPVDESKLLEQLLYHPNEPLIFNSGFFLFLFFSFFSIYVLLHQHDRLKNSYLTLFSIYFYYKSSGYFFLLLIFCAVVDYLLAKGISSSEKQRTRRFFLLCSLSVNLGLLAYFKYTNFFLSLYGDWVGLEFSPMNIFLPVGISFFTFQSLSYTIDVYRRNIKPVNNFLDFAFFVTFFPQMVAGPIVRAVEFLPQVHRKPFLSQDQYGRAVFFIISGLFKKAVISDYISTNFVDRVFDQPQLYTGLETLIGIYGYALQIYCDFSGYSEMAIGIALLLGYSLPKNFDSPYQSASITEFWRRWHISLSRWLKDYLYISLGGNRKGRFRTYINLFVTMLLGGLWHGAAGKFVLWGALHGLGLAFEKAIWARPEERPSGLYLWIRVFLTFHFVCFCWIFFRADSLTDVYVILNQIVFNFDASILGHFIFGYRGILMLMLVGYSLHFVSQDRVDDAMRWLSAKPVWLQAMILTLLILLIMQIKSSEIQPFIYFQF